MRLTYLAILLVFATSSGVARGDQDRDRVKKLRTEVLRDLFADNDKSMAVADAYKKLFTHVGLVGLPKLADDEDTSIALQAAWELYRKAVKREQPILGRTDWVFDKKPMEEFLRVVVKRLGTEPPAWWRATLLKGEVFPGEHHAFLDIEGPLPPTATIKVEQNKVVITSEKQAVRMSKAEFEKDDDSEMKYTQTVVLCGPDRSFIAGPILSGCPFKVVAAEAKTGKRLWASDVWATARHSVKGDPGPSPVELRRHGATLIVYGCESHGMYAEGFDVKTGKCQFRFCTCYWFNHPEAWTLK